MPVGKWPDFKACVAANQDKENPEAFCAWLEHQTTGKWPGQMSEILPSEAWKTYLEAYSSYMIDGIGEAEAAKRAYADLDAAGWVKTFNGWERYFAAPSMREIRDVPVFAAGLWTDSSGGTKEWTIEELDKMVAAFKGGALDRVPLKLGHSSDSFNTKVAKALGVPKELVTGEHGHGQMSIGWLSSLKRMGAKLMGAFASVPEAIADLVEAGLYHAVSAEIDDKIGKYGPVVSGVALLGAEEPAVDRATLDLALVFGKEREHTHRVIFNKEADMSEEQEIKDIGTKLKELGESLLSKFKGEDKKEGNHMADLKETKGIALSEFAEKLGIKADELVSLAKLVGVEETATIETLYSAVEDMCKKVKLAADIGEDVKTEFTSMTARMKILEADNARFERERRVTKYTRIVEALDHTATEPELAIKWADLEEKAGVEVVDDIVKQYQEADRMREQAGLLMPRGTSLHKAENEEEDPFEKTVREFAKEKSITYPQALVKMADQDPDGYATYHERQREILHS